jgi:hypothetical protein
MVPVKKPGRPLSACPHIQGQACGCSGITAAIPRRQKCNCGALAGSSSVVQRAMASVTVDQCSPTKTAFRVQKSTSRPSSRRQSYDHSNFTRVDVGGVSIMQMIAPVVHNGCNVPLSNPPYTNGLSTATPNHELPSSQQFQQDPPVAQNPTTEGFADAGLLNDGYLPLRAVEEEPLEVTIMPSFGKPTPFISGKGAIPEPAAHIGNDGERGRSSPNGPLSLSSQGPMPSGPMDSMCSYVNEQQHPFSGVFRSDEPAYQSYLAQATAFTYPPSYGSYQHPLQPSEWRRSSILHGQPGLQLQVPKSPTTVLGNMSSFGSAHACGCGDSCQCIGCATHPYNDASRDYIRSALQLSQKTAPTVIESLNGPDNSNIFSVPDAAAKANGDSVNDSNGNSSPLSDTPSDTTTVDEQAFSATDFIFVNYPYSFSNESCGGDTNNCPCGDDCNCLGCAIHRPILPSETIVSENLDDELLNPIADTTGGVTSNESENDATKVLGDNQKN